MLLLKALPGGRNFLPGRGVLLCPPDRLSHGFKDMRRATAVHSLEGDKEGTLCTRSRHYWKREKERMDGKRVGRGVLKMGVER